MRGFFRKLQGIEGAPLPLDTPDVTKAQIGGWLQFAASVGIGVGLLQPAEAEVLIGASAIVAASLHVGDAIIRKGRSGAVAALHLNVPSPLQLAAAGGTGQMGSTAPDDGGELPDSPTLDGAPEVDVSEDGTGVPVPDDVKADIEAANTTQPPPPVEAAPEPPQAPTEAVPPPPSPAEIAQAQRAADEAAGRLAALKARATATQQ